MTVSSNYSNAYSSYSSSATSSTKQTDKPNFEDLAKKLLSSMDTDNSGSIDKAEFSAAAQALASNSNSTDTNSTSTTASATDIFNKLDTNGDGSMSTDEFMTALKNSKPPEPPQGKDGGMPPPPPGGMPPSESSSASSESTASKTFAALDTNEDGTVSIDEILASLEKSKTDSSGKNSGTTSTTDSSTASSTSQTDTSSQKLSDFMLKNILSYYGNNTSSTDTTSLLSISA